MSAGCIALLHTPGDEQAQAASLKQELSIAKQEASNATETARNAEQKLLLASSAAAVPTAAADTGTAALTTAAAAAAAAAVAGTTAGGAVTASVAPATATAGGGRGLEIEKGPSPDALRLEELKAELQVATAAKKKVGLTSVCSQCATSPIRKEAIKYSPESLLVPRRILARRNTSPSTCPKPQIAG